MHARVRLQLHQLQLNLLGKIESMNRTQIQHEDIDDVLDVIASDPIRRAILNIHQVRQYELLLRRYPVPNNRRQAP